MPETLSKQERKRMKKKAYEARKRERVQKQNTLEDEPEPPSEMKERLSDEALAAINIQQKAKENLKKWEDMANLVGDFIKERKTVPNMRSNHELEKILGRWLFVQKHSYDRHKMHPYHIKRLKEVGVKLSQM